MNTRVKFHRVKITKTGTLPVLVKIVDVLFFLSGKKDNQKKEFNTFLKDKQSNFIAPQN
ncbi:MAG: hypothetical protein LH473_06445 [Chitinophagales bacterium]|nr:hypothetical protein [Chitinophagales bacterium]